MLHFIVAPYDLGQRAIGVGAGPLRVRDTGVARRVSADDVEIDVGSSTDWVNVNEQIAQQVRAAADRGGLPLVLAGNCNSCLGTLQAIQHLRPAILWFDAHGDFHTPATSRSGSLEGMSLTLATQNFVPEELVVLAGARDLEPGEDERVHRKILHIPDGDLRAHTLPKADAAYVHLDMDVLDPAISPGVNFRGPGGLTVEALVEAIGVAFHVYRIAAISIVNYNPEQDVEYRTSDIVVHVIEEIDRLRQAAASR